MGTKRLQYATELLAAYPPLPFGYDRDTRAFTVGGERVALADYEHYHAAVQEPVSVKQAAEAIEHSTLALNSLGNHYQFPRLYNWLKDLDDAAWTNVSDAVTETMIDAYANLSDCNAAQLQKGSHWGFGTSLYRPGHPVFHVLGDCACYGVSPYGMFGENMWSEGLSEYSLHNIDWKTQLVALHAGAGALARMCELETE